MNALIYLRVSTREQLEQGGLDRQQEACLAFAEQKGWSVSRIFTEGKSGSTSYEQRESMLELISVASPGTPIIVERADRIARDLIVQELFLKDCKEHKLLVYCADTGEELVQATSNAGRVLIRQILGAVAQWDKAQIVEKLQAGRRRKKLQTGKPCGGPQPYNNREVIGLIMSFYKEGHTSDRIRRELQSRRIPSPTGKLHWTPMVVWRIIQRENGEL